jgi:hypothetical protein
MKRLKIRCILILWVLTLCCVLASARAVQAQKEESSPAAAASQETKRTEQEPRRENETNLDIQLYLLVASMTQDEAAKTPPAIEPAVKQLRAALPYKSYRLAATLLNRARNGGRLNVKWVGRTVLETSAPPTSSNIPIFNDFFINSIRIVKDETGQELIRMSNLNFNTRIPVQSASLASNSGAVPVINYENTGLNTDISLRDGEPVVVGTINFGPAGEAIIIVITARKAPR